MNRKLTALICASITMLCFASNGVSVQAQCCGLGGYSSYSTSVYDGAPFYGFSSTGSGCFSGFRGLNIGSRYHQNYGGYPVSYGSYGGYSSYNYAGYGSCTPAYYSGSYYGGYGHRRLFGHRRSRVACCPPVAFSIAPSCCSPTPNCCGSVSGSVMVNEPMSVYSTPVTIAPASRVGAPTLLKETTPAMAPAAPPVPADPAPPAEAPKPEA